MKGLVTQLLLTETPVDCKPDRLLCPWNSPDKSTGVGSHSLLQGVFSTQGLNWGLLHCRWILYQLSHQGIMWVTRNKGNPPPKCSRRTMGTESDQSQAGLDSDSSSTTYEQTTTDRSHPSPHFSTSAPCKVKKNHSTHIMLYG